MNCKIGEKAEYKIIAAYIGVHTQESSNLYPLENNWFRWEYDVCTYSIDKTTKNLSITTKEDNSETPQSLQVCSNKVEDYLLSKQPGPQGKQVQPGQQVQSVQSGQSRHLRQSQVHGNSGQAQEQAKNEEVVPSIKYHVNMMNDAHLQGGIFDVDVTVYPNRLTIESYSDSYNSSAIDVQYRAITERAQKQMTNDLTSKKTVIVLWSYNIIKQNTQYHSELLSTAGELDTVKPLLLVLENKQQEMQHKSSSGRLIGNNVKSGGKQSKSTRKVNDKDIIVTNHKRKSNGKEKDRMRVELV